MSVGRSKGPQGRGRGGVAGVRSAAELLERAKRAHFAPADRNVSFAKWEAAIVELRGRDFTWRMIWQWLRDQGEAVHGDWRSFAAGASRVHRKYRERGAREARS